MIIVALALTPSTSMTHVDCEIIQYRHLIPAPVDRTPTSVWLYMDTSMGNMSKYKSSTSMTLAASESNLQNVQL